MISGIMRGFCLDTLGICRPRYLYEEEKLIGKIFKLIEYTNYYIFTPNEKEILIKVFGSTKKHLKQNPQFFRCTP